MTETVGLLLKLQEPGSALCNEFISCCDRKLKNQIKELKLMQFQDVIEFIDSVSNGFLSDLCSAVHFYTETFLNKFYADDNT